MPSETDRERARAVLRRGAEAGQTIPRCSCFNDDKVGRRCNGVCEDAADYVAAAFTSIRADERERAAKIAEQEIDRYFEDVSAVDVRLSNQRGPKWRDGRAIAAAIRKGATDADR